MNSASLLSGNLGDLGIDGINLKDLRLGAVANGGLGLGFVDFGIIGLGFVARKAAQLASNLPRSRLRLGNS